MSERRLPDLPARVRRRRAQLGFTSPATVVTLYLLPESNALLRPKFDKELRQGTLVICHNYHIPGWEDKETRSEIVKDIEDIEGDRVGRALTFPIRFGRTKALALATTILIVLLVAVWIPAATAFYGPAYGILLLPFSAVVLVAVVRMWKDPSPNNLRRQSTLLKAAMILGLAAVVAGSL